MSDDSITKEQADKIYAEQREVRFNELDVQRLNLQPGELLVVTIKSDEVSQESMYELRKGLEKYFPNNKILVLGHAVSDNIALTVAKDMSYSEEKPQVSGCGPTPADYCSSCSCGKKEAFERKQGE